MGIYWPCDAAEVPLAASIVAPTISGPCARKGVVTDLAVVRLVMHTHKRTYTPLAMHALLVLGSRQAIGATHPFVRVQRAPWLRVSLPSRSHVVCSFVFVCVARRFGIVVRRSLGMGCSWATGNDPSSSSLLFALRCRAPAFRGDVRWYQGPRALAPRSSPRVLAAALRLVGRPSARLSHFFSHTSVRTLNFPTFRTRVSGYPSLQAQAARGSFFPRLGTPRNTNFRA